jgi:hypothetical protein
MSYLVQHKNGDGVVPNHLRVSAGEDTWASWEFMHGDYFAANWLIFNAELLDDCLRVVSDSDPRPAKCGRG